MKTTSSCSGCAADKSSSLLIGWASRDVTPKEKVNVAGQFHMRITNVVRDPVTVTALAISGGQDPADSFIFISCDTCMIPAYVVDKTRQIIAAKNKDFPVQNLVLNATHTHTAPDIRPGVYDYSTLKPEDLNGTLLPEVYRDYYSEKIAEAALESWAHRRAGSVAWGLGYAVVGHNRRTVYCKNFSERPEYQDTPGWEIKTNAQMYGTTDDPWFSHMEGGVDHAVQFLFTFDNDKKLTGSVINLVCPSQETEGLSEISADFWHDIRVALRAKYGQNLFVLPQCAAAGDQSPHLMLHKKAHERRLKLKGMDARQEIAEKVAAAFDETLAWARKDIQTQAPLGHAVREIHLTRRPVTPDEYQKNVEWLRQAQAGQRELTGLSLDRCRQVVADYEAQRKNIARVQPVEVHVVRLGDVVFATNPFELFLDFGLRIQAQSPAVQTFIVQLAGKGIDHGGGYLSTERASQGGGYSACIYCNAVGFQGGQELVEDTLKTIKSLWT